MNIKDVIFGVGAMIVGTIVIGAMIVRAMIVGAMIVGTMVVGAMIVGAMRRPRLHHMVILGTQNKITDFFLISARLSRFNIGPYI